jgi:hypothetical protein
LGKVKQCIKRCKSMHRFIYDSKAEDGYLHHWMHL